MGLFGRDDRRTPEPSTVPAMSGATAPPGSAKGAPDATTIAKGCTIEGSISASGDILIHGAFEGEIRGAARLVIAESGKVKAQLRAMSIVVAGSVQGDVFAEDKIELKPSANLAGNITAPKILIQEGATFEGQVFMKNPGTDASASTGGKGHKDTRPIPQGAASPATEAGSPKNEAKDGAAGADGPGKGQSGGPGQQASSQAQGQDSKKPGSTGPGSGKGSRS